MTFRNTINFFTTGVTLDVHVEDDHWWATCPGCPGFSAAANSWDDLMRLVAEFHGGDEANHRDWLMFQPFSWMGPPTVEDDPTTAPVDPT